MGPEQSRARRELETVKPETGDQSPRSPSVRLAIPTRGVLLIFPGGLADGELRQNLELRAIAHPDRATDTDKFVCAWCWTVTGNVYRIQPMNDGSLDVLGARKGRRYKLSEREASQITVKVGERCQIGKRHTGHIVMILAMGPTTPLRVEPRLSHLIRCTSTERGKGAMFVPSLQANEEGSAAAIRPHALSRIASHRRPVLLLNGRGTALGVERSTFELRHLASTRVSGRDAFEAFFRTESGTTYGLIRDRKNNLLLLNDKRGNAVRVDRGSLENLTTSIGERLSWLGGAEVSPVSQIITLHKVKPLGGAPDIALVRESAQSSSLGYVSAIRHHLLTDCVQRLGAEHMRALIKGR